MTDAALSLVLEYGVVLLAGITFLSCMAVPVPSSLLMLAAGGFWASGDMNGLGVLAAAYGGAVMGDQGGYQLGRLGGRRRIADLADQPGKGKMIRRVRTQLDRHGAMGVFLTRWLLSPLGPYMNIAAGAAGFDWRRFTLASLAGEAVWVAIYVGLGHGFAGDIIALAGLLGNATGALAAGAVAVGLGFWLVRALARRHHSAD